mmetsp:Transcript_55286/g.140216  ORF Transcript_55286/g.140216 Transcript_55286/m.140216 type:complete len:237 (+) Transcript_55286:82-792(+)
MPSSVAPPADGSSTQHTNTNPTFSSRVPTRPTDLRMGTATATAASGGLIAAAATAVLASPLGRWLPAASALAPLSHPAQAPAPPPAPASAASPAATDTATSGFPRVAAAAAAPTAAAAIPASVRARSLLDRDVGRQVLAVVPVKLDLEAHSISPPQRARPCISELACMHEEVPDVWVIRCYETKPSVLKPRGHQPRRHVVRSMLLDTLKKPPPAAQQDNLGLPATKHSDCDKNMGL